MTTLLIIIFFIIGSWFGWHYSNVIDDFVQHLKTIYHGKEK